jgi:hypothetical protein
VAKIDEVKEFIGFLKAIFITLIVIDTSLMAWVFQNYESASLTKLYFVNGLILFISVTVALLFLKILKEIKTLKDYK